jgi:hypothetical protein
MRGATQSALDNTPSLRAGVVSHGRRRHVYISFWDTIYYSIVNVGHANEHIQINSKVDPLCPVK